MIGVLIRTVRRVDKDTEGRPRDIKGEAKRKCSE